MNFIMLMYQLRTTQEINNWRTLSFDSRLPPEEFYALLEAALRQRQIPELEISQKDFNESNVLSDRRVYMRLKRGQLVFDCCAAPFGVDYFFSYWLLLFPRAFTLFHGLGLAVALGLLPALLIQQWGLVKGLVALIFVFLALYKIGETGVLHAKREAEDFLHGLSVFGVIWELFFRLPTYFERDSATVFLTVIHECYLKVLDDLTQTHGIRKLTEKERRKPKMRDFYK